MPLCAYKFFLLNSLSTLLVYLNKVCVTEALKSLFLVVILQYSKVELLHVLFRLSGNSIE